LKLDLFLAVSEDQLQQFYSWHICSLSYFHIFHFVELFEDINVRFRRKRLQACSLISSLNSDFSILQKDVVAEEVVEAEVEVVTVEEEAVETQEAEGETVAEAAAVEVEILRVEGEVGVVEVLHHLLAEIVTWAS
jgi:hypothetical protein